MDLFKDIISSITSEKNYLGNEEECNSTYVPFVINRHFSFGKNTLPFAAALNSYPGLDKKLQYDFYYHSLPKKKQFNKWHKGKKPEDLEAVMEYYNCSYLKAMEVINVLTSEQMSILKSRLFKGDEQVKQSSKVKDGDIS